MRLINLLAASLVVFLVSSSLLVWFYPTTRDFDPENPFWNGSKNSVKLIEAKPIDNLNELPESSEKAVLIEIPYEPLSEQELVKLSDFLTDEGVLILMDDYGYGNMLLEHLDLSVRFANTPLLDPLFCYKNKWLPKITNVSQTLGVECIVLNHATALVNVSKEVEVVAWSSSFSFLDTDGDSYWSEGEPIGPLPVSALTRVGGGLLILVSDPSILINSMIDMADNRMFLSALIDLGGRGREVLLDTSHVPETTLEEAKAVLKSVRDFLALPCITPPVVAVIIVIATRSLWSKARGEQVERRAG